MRKTKVVMLSLLVAVLFTGCGNKVDDAVKLMEDGQYKEAAQKYQESIDGDENLSEAYLGKATAYYELKEYPAAKQCFTDAISNGAEETPVIYNMLAVCDMEQENIDSAMVSYEKGIDLGADAEEYAEVVQEMRYNLIVCYEKKTDWENAKAKMQEYISMYPDDEAAQREAEFLETR